MRYRNRQAAGRELAGHLQAYAGPDTLVLGIPRGGVVVAAAVAAALGAGLGVVVTRKIPSPWHPEVAVGAVAPDGAAVVDAAAVGAAGLPAGYLEQAAQQAAAEIARRLAAYTGGRPLSPLAGRPVVVVDDGLATGLTAEAAVAWLQRQGARQVVLAVPVGAADAVARLRRLCPVVCPLTPDDFRAVGLHYDDFRQVADAEVVACLSGPGAG